MKRSVAILSIILIGLATFPGIKSCENETFIGRMVLDEVPLIDGHNDLPYNLYRIEGNKLNDFDFDSDLRQNPKWQVSSSHTDLPRLRQGKVGGQFWVAYVGCETNYKDAVERTMEQIDVVKRLVAKYPKSMQLVTTADGIMQAFNASKIASLICVEGGHSIDSRLSVLRLFYELGVRYMTLTHNCNTPWADNHQQYSQSNVPKIGGLNKFGKDIILEMNRLGMMVDLSHVSKDVMLDALNVTLAPVIFSHSSSRAVYNVTRNADDEVLLKLKNNGGIIMLNFYPGFIAPRATIYDVIAHINHIKSVIGPDHIGLGGDYDGVSSQPVGLEDVSKYPDLFDLLAEDGHGYEPWNREDLQKLAGLNLIRVYKEVEIVRDFLLKNGTAINDSSISREDLIATNVTLTCRTNLGSGVVDTPAK
jgi:membrane dipeptidase